MHQHPDEHGHRNLESFEQPLDAANQSLSDALRASFRILKGIMMVLVVLYLFSNVRRVDSHEQALQLRLGRLLPQAHEPGLVWALPFPIDEIVPLPTKRSNDQLIESHTFRRTREEIGKPLAYISRGNQGLDPAYDGALLAADAGLVHVRWKVVYKIDDVIKYVANIVGNQVEAAEGLIKAYVESVGIEIATELTAEEIIRTRVDYVQTEMKRRINERLRAIDSGVMVTLVEMNEPTPPIQVRDAFDRTQRAENAKQQQIREAEQERTRILSEAAGAAHDRLTRTLDALDSAQAAGASTEELKARLSRMLLDEAEGAAGQLIKDAGAFQTVVVSGIESDIRLYRKLLPEFERNPTLMIARLWEQTRQEILGNPGVTKFYRPPGSQFRLHIPLDPEQTRADEELRLQEQKFDITRLRPRRSVPIGPGNE